jgi:acyl carrier protein
MNRKDFIKNVSLTLLSGYSLNLMANTEKMSLKQIMKAIEKKYVCNSKEKLSTCIFNPKSFGWDKHMTKELGFDSLDTVEFIMYLEKDFNISIKDAEAEKVTTPRHLAVLVHRYVNEK